jgi:DNA-binding IclR family transcriptional regulator
LTIEEIGAAIFAAETAQARGTLFLIMLYVNLYCGRLLPENAAKRGSARPPALIQSRQHAMHRVAYCREGPIKFGTVAWRLNPVGPHTKQTTSEKPASPRKAAVARLAQPPQGDIDDDADDRQRVGVQSLGRAFAILEEVARHREGIGLADLSKLVDLHNSTTFHLAKTMVSLGYLRQEKDSKRYRVGRPLFALAASALDEIEMVNVATPVLEDLSRETSESSHFAVRMGDAVVVIARTSGPGAFQLTDRVGVVRPAHCTALGKIILASLRPDQLKRFLERVDLKPSTTKSITEIPVLLREIAEIKRSGIAFDDGEFNPEVRCVAVPVTDFTGQVIGALGISGPIWRLSNQALHSSAQIVQAAANRLSAEFGAKTTAKSS